MRIVFVFLLLVSPLFAERIVVDRFSRSFELGKQNKCRVDTFDFAGDYPHLENIDIDAKRKKNVEFHLTGDYPLLESVNYQGSFGVLSAKLTGNFPCLQTVNFLCTSCAMNFDLMTSWQRSCEIHIRGLDQNVTLTLPHDIGLVIHTKTALKGKVLASDQLKKKGWFGICNKTFQNEMASTASTVLTIYIEVTDGFITLN